MFQKPPFCLGFHHFVVCTVYLGCSSLYNRSPVLPFEHFHYCQYIPVFFDPDSSPFTPSPPSDWHFTKTTQFALPNYRVHNEGPHMIHRVGRHYQKEFTYLHHPRRRCLKDLAVIYSSAILFSLHSSDSSSSVNKILHQYKLLSIPRYHHLYQFL